MALQVQIVRDDVEPTLVLLTIQYPVPAPLSNDSDNVLLRVPTYNPHDDVVDVIVTRADLLLALRAVGAS